MLLMEMVPENNQSILSAGWDKSVPALDMLFYKTL